MTAYGVVRWRTCRGYRHRVAVSDGGGAALAKARVRPSRVRDSKTVSRRFETSTSTRTSAQLDLLQPHTFQLGVRQSNLSKGVQRKRRPEIEQLDAYVQWIADTRRQLGAPESEIPAYEVQDGPGGMTKASEGRDVDPGWWIGYCRGVKKPNSPQLRFLYPAGEGREVERTEVYDLLKSTH
jgi:hypothetical protein